MATPTAPPTPPPPRRVLPASGLLDHITATSLDEDYAHVAERRRAAAGREDDLVSRRPRSAPLLAVLAVFGLLLTTAAVQTARTASSQQRSRDSLVAQVQDRRAELTEARDELRGLRRDIGRASRAEDAATAAARELQQRARRLGAATGTVAVTGPGVRITVDDRPDARTKRQVVLDEDLQRLVNGLWVAGAEAVAINGERLTALSAIRGAGEAITVNFRSLRRPYVIEAVGDPDDLPARFIESAGGTWWLNLESVYQLRFDMSSEDSVTLPAAPPPSLRHVRDGRRGAGR
jgi:uncharacterized protein YlxW (UPF0749 family)